MRNIILIGAGQIGSRHLQALKSVKIPLNIYVVDPSNSSLLTAKERYNLVNIQNIHNIVYVQKPENITGTKKIDLAIVATNSDVRSDVVKNLLRFFEIRNLILEKILFNKLEDYVSVDKLLEEKKCRCWVDMSMRTMPFYNSLKKKFDKDAVLYSVTGSSFGLITNAIHYIDYIAYLSDCYDYEIITDYLEAKPVESKRKGFLELNGTICLNYKNGSKGFLTCFTNGNLPVQMEIISSNCKYIVKESEKKAWVANSKNRWKWKEINIDIPYQSQMTNLVVESILNKGTCPLTSYKKSAKLHVVLLDSLYKFLNESSNTKRKFYPFT